MNFASKPLRDTARGAPCMLEVSGICNRDPETSVWCHSNSSADGKGKSLKAHDCFGAIGCAACHAWLDQGRESAARKREVFERGFRKTLLWLWQTGRITVAGRRPRETTAQTIPKILPRDAYRLRDQA